MGSFLASTEIVRTSDEPETFGKGISKGIAAFERANNAVYGGARGPMLTFGFPVITMLLGYILGPNLQEFLRRSLPVRNGDPTTFFTNPDSVFFVVLTVIFFYFLVIRKPAKMPGSASF